MNKNTELKSSLIYALCNAYDNSDLWRRKLLSQGVERASINLDFPFEHLGLLNKAELLDDQSLNPPYGSLLATKSEAIRRVHRTSGSTGKPLYIFLTNNDILNTIIPAVKAFSAAGLTRGQKIVHCLNFNMWSGGLSDYMALEQCGATCIPFGVGNSELLIATIKNLGVNAISSTPSYMKVLEHKCNELKINPQDLGLKWGYFGGEGLVNVPGYKEYIESTFGMRAIDANYGMSEVCSIIAGQTLDSSDLMFHAHGIVYPELIDATGKCVDIRTGAVGELVLTTLRREAQPLFRYRTNDMIKITGFEEGIDGFDRFSFLVLGRCDEMIVHKGVNFFPQSLQSIFSSFPNELTGRYNVIRPPALSIAPIQINIEIKPNVACLDHLKKLIVIKVQKNLSVTIEPNFVGTGQLAGNENKAKYLIEG